MASNQTTLSQFVRDALVAGKSRNEIRSALSDAGWSTPEVDRALAGFADGGFLPPVPRPVPHVTARDAFLYLLLFATLGFVAHFLIQLVHGVIDQALQDAADENFYVARSYSTIRWAISWLIVCTPIFLWVTRLTDKAIEQDQGRQRSLVRKWLTYIALFVAAMVLLGDAAYVIFKFLSGEMTLRFLLKALTVAAVTGAIFVHYLRDVRDRPDAG